MEKLKVGDEIRWNFHTNHPLYRKHGYLAKVAAILDEGYGVYCEYGQDIIPFDSDNIISK